MNHSHRCTETLLEIIIKNVHIRFVLTFLLARAVHMTTQLFSNELLPEYSSDFIEDESDYLPSSANGNNYDNYDYDFSPPNGELPSYDYNKVAGPLNAYLENSGQNDRSGRRESYIEYDGLNDEKPKKQLEEAASFSRKKKNQVLCRVQKIVHHHTEAGHEFFPKSFTSYSCHPATSALLEGGLSTSQDTCFVTGNNCITIEKEQLFLKRRHNTNCWNHFIEAVGAGCKCLSRKYHN